MALGGAASAQVAQEPDAKPNVIVIYVDDLGYGDVSCYGATKLQTPNIDRLAMEGRRFTDAHSPSAVCTPSRYGLLTGEYPFRKNVWGPAAYHSPLLIDPAKLTLGTLFKNAGYATACIGKWHLGFGKKGERTDWNAPLRPGPLDLGFDYFFGVPVVNSYSPFVYVENDRIVGWDPNDPLVENSRTPTLTSTYPLRIAGLKGANRFGGAKKAHALYDDEKTAILLTEKAAQWITQRKDEPFFLYFPTPNIHHPCTPNPRFKGTSQCGAYGDFVHELDWMVGELLSCLDKHNLTDNTLVVFTSDNGGMFNRPGQNAFVEGEHKINGELLGFKFGVWEGGHRVPFVARWPGRVPAGTESTHLISSLDLLATFAQVTGQSLSKEDQADSINILEAFTDNPKEPIRERLILIPSIG
jgi:arylsulfatase A-like enzyme